MSKLPVSVIVLTWNSGATLAANLKSLAEMAEIIVVDGGSTDDTLKIAEANGTKVVSQEKLDEPITDFSAVRNAAQKHCTQPWILHLDSDEMLSSECIAEIKATIEANQPVACLVPRKYILTNGKTVAYATSYPNERLYFFHREVFKTWIKPVHERPELTTGTTTKRFKSGSLAPIGTVEEYKAKNLRYLKLEKTKSHGKGWGHWFKHRLIHTTRSRIILLIRLLWIWLIPRRGVRLPLKHELMRFWYGWKLVWSTCPLFNKN